MLDFDLTTISIPLPSSDIACCVAVGDFNGDGKQDVALLAAGAFDTSPPNEVVVLLGKGNGTFEKGSVYPAGIASRGLTVGDFNGDGKQDLAVANVSSGDVSVLLGNGNGTFQPVVSVPAQVGTVNVPDSGPSSVAVGDFNGDGRQDLALLFPQSGQIGVLLGNGDGTFQPLVVYLVDKDPCGRSGARRCWVAVADFNRDNNLDLVTVNTRADDVSVLLGNGDGTFRPAMNLSAGQRPSRGVVGDFNRDGKLDLAILSASFGTINVLLGNGDGTFQAPQPYSIGGSPNSIVMADFDSDGKLDLAVDVNSSAPNVASLAVLRGNGDGTFRPPIRLDTWVNPTNVFEMALGDFNNDGKPDLVVANRVSSTSGNTADLSILINTTKAFMGSAITGVVNAASFLPGIAASTWITIEGTNLSQKTRSWGSSDFLNNSLPTQLDGVSAQVNGIPAYVYYISPTQLNLLAPDDSITGQVQVQVTNAQGTSNSFATNKTQFSPAFFMFTAKYPAAVHTSGVHVGPVGLIAGAAFAPAKPGETILLFGTGFGPTNPLLPAGKLVTAPAPLVNGVMVTIGGKSAQVLFAGLSGSGLDQLNVTVPADLPDGDASLVATVHGVSTQANIFVAVQH
jgi:uncharacterized protein (TIGR03437 family)